MHFDPKFLEYLLGPTALTVFLLVMFTLGSRWVRSLIDERISEIKSALRECRDNHHLMNDKYAILMRQYGELEGKVKILEQFNGKLDVNIHESSD